MLDGVAVSAGEHLPIQALACRAVLRVLGESIAKAECHPTVEALPAAADATHAVGREHRFQLRELVGRERCLGDSVDGHGVSTESGCWRGMRHAAIINTVRDMKLIELADPTGKHPSMWVNVDHVVSVTPAHLNHGSTIARMPRRTRRFSPA